MQNNKYQYIKTIVTGIRYMADLSSSVIIPRPYCRTEEIQNYSTVFYDLSENRFDTETDLRRSQSHWSKNKNPRMERRWNVKS